MRNASKLEPVPATAEDDTDVAEGVVVYDPSADPTEILPGRLPLNRYGIDLQTLLGAPLELGAPANGVMLVDDPTWEAELTAERRAAEAQAREQACRASEVTVARTSQPVASSRQDDMPTVVLERPLTTRDGGSPTSSAPSATLGPVTGGGVSPTSSPPATTSLSSRSRGGLGWRDALMLCIGIGVGGIAGWLLRG